MKIGGTLILKMGSVDFLGAVQGKVAAQLLCFLAHCQGSFLPETVVSVDQSSTPQSAKLWVHDCKWYLCPIAFPPNTPNSPRSIYMGWFSYKSNFGNSPYSCSQVIFIFQQFSITEVTRTFRPVRSRAQGELPLVASEDASAGIFTVGIQSRTFQVFDSRNFGYESYKSQ